MVSIRSEHTSRRERLQDRGPTGNYAGNGSHGLVSSLLSLPQQVPTEKVLLDMNALAQTAVKLSQPQLRARNVEVHTELALDVPQILGDSNQLLQVCLHITNNALQAMAQTGGVVSGRTRRHEQFVQLE